LAALARHTPLKLGTGVTLIPTWHPLQLAYDSAVLDQITGGRFILGVGLGGPALARRFGVDPSILGDYMDDTLAILRALWAGEDGYRGKALSVERGIGIRPIQPGGPPLWVGGAIRRSAARAARWGDGWIASSSYSFAQVAGQAQRYRAALAIQGKDASAPVVVANRITLVADSEAEARRDGREWCGPQIERYVRVGGIAWDAGAGADLFDGLEADRCLIGTPEQVVARVRRYADAGVTHIQARVSLADCPLEIAARSIELLGRSVLPEFQ
jgi:alkanesulfonate monooxygenase SsuD/methylene tetrahydromethanopterin reductase-like flavin-dependent oxidoreductase (luciferase family)